MQGTDIFYVDQSASSLDNGVQGAEVEGGNPGGLRGVVE